MMILSGLVDAQQMARENPGTFDAPSAAELALIAPDRSVVKICRNEERFWVLVKKVYRKRIVGEVNNHLTRNDDLPVGTEVAFETRHIYDIDDAGPGRPTCDECGEPLDDQNIFNGCMNQVVDAMMATTNDDMEAGLLANAVALYLSSFDAAERKAERRRFIRLMDDLTKDAVVAQCDA